MKENKDRHQVVIAREMYDDLMYLAAIGDNERNGDTATVSQVRRHAQKYNKHLHEERQVEVAKQEAEYRELRGKVIAMIISHTGEMVWLRQVAPPQPGLTERPVFYLGCQVVGRSEHGKLFVKIKNMDGTNMRDIHIKALRLELPEGYVYEESGMHKHIAYDRRVMEPRKPYQIITRE